MLRKSKGNVHLISNCKQTAICQPATISDTFSPRGISLGSNFSWQRERCRQWQLPELDDAAWLNHAESRVSHRHHRVAQRSVAQVMSSQCCWWRLLVRNGINHCLVCWQLYGRHLHEERPNCCMCFWMYSCRANEFSHRSKCPSLFLLRIALYSPAFLQGMLLGRMGEPLGFRLKIIGAQKKQKIPMDMDGLIMWHHIFLSEKSS